MRTSLVRACGVGLLIAVLALALGVDPPRPHVIPQQDKLEHVVAFLALGLVFGWNATVAGLIVSAAALISAALGIEVAQGFTHTGRDPELADAAASVVGVFCGLFIAMAIARLSSISAGRSNAA